MSNTTAEIEPNLNPIAAEIARRMTDQGFWEDWDFAKKAIESSDLSDDCELIKRLSRSLKRALISEKLMLIITEPSEGMEAHRKNRHMPGIAGAEELLHMRDEDHAEQLTPFEQFIKDTFEDELADTFIRLLDLCGKLKIDIDFHIKHKCKYNATRAHKHGKSC